MRILVFNARPMKGKKIIILAVISIAAVAILFLAPIVPFSKTWYTATTQEQPAQLTSCSGSIYAVDPTLVFQGYESITQYFAGVGIMVYTGCYMPQ